jgi:hypothetical protein
VCVLCVLCVFVCSGPLLCIVQACFKDMIRFIVLVFFVMLPFVAGLSQRFRYNVTGFETFEMSGGSFMKMFVDPGEILPPLIFDAGILFLWSGL